VQLSRRLIPGLPSYSLGKICAELGIQIHGRHRASGDAYATVKLFEHLLSLSREEGTAVNQLAAIDKQHLNPNLDLSCLQALPEEAGTYYFFNDQRELIYIGKSNNIRKRVYSHFRNYSSRKAIEMLNAIAEIDYELTGSELIALLRESDEIKKLKPLYNRAQRRAISVYGLYYFTDSNGYLRLVLDKSSKREEIPLISFPNLRSGKSYLNANILEYELCQKLCGLYPNSGACFSYEIAGCKGACIGKESPESYNKRAQDLINRFSYSHSSFFILDKGREDTEQGVVKIENGRYLGFGYADLQGEGNQITRLHSCIQSLEDNRDVQQIIRNYLARHPHIKIIPFNSHDES
jgi:DNA polymerase-3 subunit epsilon